MALTIKMIEERLDLLDHFARLVSSPVELVAIEKVRKTLADELKQRLRDAGERGIRLAHIDTQGRRSTRH